ncbi:MAG: DinB family protein [Ignavibacteria bacterium]
MDSDNITRSLLKQFLLESKAHATFEQAVDNFPIEYINKKVDGIEYSAWQLVEHIGISLMDIYEFTVDENFKSPDWPEGYWPDPDEKADKEKWDNSINQIKDYHAKLIRLLDDNKTDLYSDLPHAKGYNILREVILVIDHNAYHVGQLVLLRKLLGIW